MRKQLSDFMKVLSSISLRDFVTSPGISRDVRQKESSACDVSSVK